VRPGDEILAVDGFPVDQMLERELLESFRGNDVIGSKCRLAILREGRHTEADVLRTNATFARKIELLLGLGQQVIEAVEGHAPPHALRDQAAQMQQTLVQLERHRILNEHLLASKLHALQAKVMQRVAFVEARLRPFEGVSGGGQGDRPSTLRTRTEERLHELEQRWEALIDLVVTLKGPPAVTPKKLAATMSTAGVIGHDVVLLLETMAGPPRLSIKEAIERLKGVAIQDLRDMKAKVGMLERDKTTLQMDKAALERDRAEMQRTMSDKDADRARLERDIEDMQSDMAGRLDNIRTEVSKEHEESSEKNIALQREVTSLRKDRTLLERDKVALVNDKKGQEMVIEELRNDLARVERDKIEVEIAMTEEVGRLRGGVTKEGSDRAAKISTFEKESVVLRAERVTMGLRIEAVEREKKILEESRLKLQGEVAHLESSAREEHRKVADLSTELQLMEMGREEEFQRVLALEKEIQEQKAQSQINCPEPADHQLAKTLRKRVDELLAELEALRAAPKAAPPAPSAAAAAAPPPPPAAAAPPPPAAAPDRKAPAMAGIGLLLEKDGKTGRINVKKVISGGAAGKDGTIKEGDRVVSVNHVDVDPIPLDQTLEQVKGLEGTAVDIIIEREGGPLTVSLTRSVPKKKEGASLLKKRGSTKDLSAA